MCPLGLHGAGLATHGHTEPSLGPIVSHDQAASGPVAAQGTVATTPSAVCSLRATLPQPLALPSDLRAACHGKGSGDFDGDASGLSIPRTLMAEAPGSPGHARTLSARTAGGLRWQEACCFVFVVFNPHPRIFPH